MLREHHRHFFQRTHITPDNLYTVCLSFRLLRQAGFPITQDVFKCFMNKNGNEFDEDLREDMEGLLALYEASHLDFEGEQILDKAATFSARILSTNSVGIFEDQHDQPVKYTLQNPRHKTMARLVAKNFLEKNVPKNEWTILLQDLARMDQAVVGSLFHDEVLQVVKWWDGLELTKELESARDQPKKWHMWSMSVLQDPTMSWHRILLTKPVSLVYIVDDIFDIYGTMDQLELFTNAIKRWEIFDSEGLPNYMKTCFEAIQETTQEIIDIVYQNHGFDPSNILKRSWGELFDAFLTEAKWFGNGHLAKADEYLSNGIVSSGVPMVLTHLFFILGDNVWSEEAHRVLSNGDHNNILYLVGMILRLFDDLGSAQDEQCYGNDGSYVECYMKDFEVSSHAVAKKHVMKKVSETWKKLNKRALSSSSSSNPFSESFRNACLNVARMVPVIYDKGRKNDLLALAQCFESTLNEDE
nr:terpene synthase 39 [Andrographis paniculata]